MPLCSILIRLQLPIPQNSSGKNTKLKRLTWPWSFSCFPIKFSRNSKGYPSHDLRLCDLKLDRSSWASEKMAAKAESRSRTSQTDAFWRKSVEIMIITSLTLISEMILKTEDIFLHAEYVWYFFISCCFLKDEKGLFASNLDIAWRFSALNVGFP